MQQAPISRIACMPLALVLGIALLGTALLVGAATAQAPDTPVSSDDAPATATRSQQGVAGIVLSQAGKPIAGALISAVASGARDGPIPDIAIYSDVDGRFFWPLRPGVYRLEATAARQKIGSTLINVRAGQMTARIVGSF